MLRIGFAAAVICFATAQLSTAAVVSGFVTKGKGEFEQISDASGMTIGKNNQQSDNLLAFDERQNVRLDRDVMADIGGTLTKGTVVSSHYVFFDPLGGRQKGFVEFDSPIVGILTSLGTMISTDALLGLDAVTYLSHRLRGLEDRDVVGIDQAYDNRLLVDWRAASPGDYIRVLTAGVPVIPNPLPASGLMLLGGLGIIAVRRRRLR